MAKCRHVMEVVRETDDKMLYGHYTYQRCRKCGMGSLPPGVNIHFLLEHFAQALGITYEDLTPSLLAKASTLMFPYRIGEENMKYGCFFSKELRIEQAKLLLDNPDKCIQAKELQNKC